MAFFLFDTGATHSYISNDDLLEIARTNKITIEKLKTMLEINEENINISLEEYNKLSVENKNKYNQIEVSHNIVIEKNIELNLNLYLNLNGEEKTINFPFRYTKDKSLIGMDILSRFKIIFNYGQDLLLYDYLPLPSINLNKITIKKKKNFK